MRTIANPRHSRFPIFMVDPLPTRSLLATAAAAFILLPSLHAQQSKWYLGENSAFRRVLEYQNGAGSVLYTRVHANNPALYVDGEDQVTRHVGRSSSSVFTSTGGEYTLAGGFTGVVFENPLALFDGQILDAAFDGEHVYVVTFQTGNVYRLNKDYTNPQFLFNVTMPELGPFATITHDGVHDTLWTGEWVVSGRPSKIVQWDLSGNMISSFDTGASALGALAWDPADGTLWVVQNGGNVRHLQFDRNGNLLDSYPRTANQLTGGEFARVAQPHPPANTPPAITSCPPKATIGCSYSAGAEHTVTVGVSDADNDPLTVTWSVNGSVVATEVIVGGTPAASLTHPFPFGDNAVIVSVSDGNATPALCESTVCVVLDGAPVPLELSLPDATGECSVTMQEAPQARACSDGSIVTGTSDQALPLEFDQQGEYTITWTYTDPNAQDPAAPNASSTQEQMVRVIDMTPPEVVCPPDIAVAFGNIPPTAATVEDFLAQGGAIYDNCGLDEVTLESFDASNGGCPLTIMRTYLITDGAGNAALPCSQIITVENLFTEGGVLWQQPLARNGMSEDTDPGAAGTLKYRFKAGRTVPVKVRAEGCDGDITSNSNVTGTIVVYGDTDMDGAVDGNALPIDYSGVGGPGGLMDKIGGHLQYNLDTGQLPQTTKCYLLEVTVTDTSTGETLSEIVPIQAK